MEGKILGHKKDRGLVWLTKNGAIFYCKKVGSVGIGFSEKAVVSFEVYDRDQLTLEIKNTLEANSFPPLDFIGIVGEDALFAKMVEKNTISGEGQSLAHATQQSDNDKQKEFITIVPFEDVSCVEVDAGDSKLLVATNKEYLSEFRRILEELGFGLEMVFPSVVLDKSLDFSPGLNDGNAGVVIRNRKDYQKYNLIEVPKKTENVTIMSVSNSNQNASSKKRVIFLISVLGFLLLILGVLVYINFI